MHTKMNEVEQWLSFFFIFSQHFSTHQGTDECSLLALDGSLYDAFSTRMVQVE